MPVQLTDVTNLSDVLLQNNYELLFPNPPGGGDGRALLIQNASVQMPGRGNHEVSYTLHRHTAKMAGSRDYTNQFTASFLETGSRRVMSALQSWQEIITDKDTGCPSLKSDYATSCTITLLGANCNVVETRRFHNVWLLKFDQTELNGGQDQVITYTAEFRFDWWDFA